jgi:hypothetical protein
MRILIMISTAIAATLAWVPAALAQTVPTAGYAGIAGEVQEQIGVVGRDAVLPFTGLDLALLAGGGLLLAAVGIAVRRFGHADS